VEAHAVDVHQNLFRKVGLTGRISISKHGPDRRDQAELVENGRSTHIARVKNQLHSAEGIVHPWSQ
jgi:hypothetical protein